MFPAVSEPQQSKRKMVATRKAVPYESDGRLDLKNPDIYADDSYHSLLSRIRTEEPVYWNPEADGAGFWAITRYDDALQVLRDPETFSAAAENGGMRIFNKQQLSGEPVYPSILTSDPPQHTHLRRALLPMFATQTIARREKEIRSRAQSLVGAIAPVGHAEFVSAVAAPMTLGMLTDLLDVPEAEGHRLFQWSNAIVGDDDPEYQETVEFRRECVAKIDAYAEHLLTQRKGGAGQDFVSLLANAKIDGRELDYGTYLENFVTFVIAANETTRHAICAGLLALSRFPQEKAKLIAEPGLMPFATKEIIRWATPGMHVRRTAMKDVEIGGTKIAKGDKVVVWYTSANRDESIWPDAFTFDIGRYADKSTAPHLAFGSAPHACLGWRLAELQVIAVFEELLNRLPDIHVTQPPRRLRSNWIAGFKEMHVAFTPERGAPA